MLKHRLPKYNQTGRLNTAFHTDAAFRRPFITKSSYIKTNHSFLFSGGLIKVKRIEAI